MPSTPAWALPYPNETDPADVPVDIQALATRLDTLLTQIKAAGAIPGEVKLWPGGTLPLRASFGHWVWADGTDYDSVTYPLSAGAIAAQWRTALGKPDPGAGRFRVPDLRGVAPVGMDAMPGQAAGTRANRMARAVALVQGAVAGEEVHALGSAEMPAHAHTVNDPTHAHPVYDPQHVHYLGSGGPPPYDYVGAFDIGQRPTGTASNPAATGVAIYAAGTGISLQNAGGGGAHENTQPSVFVPYIVKLDD